MYSGSFSRSAVTLCTATPTLTVTPGTPAAGFSFPSRRTFSPSAATSTFAAAIRSRSLSPFVAIFAI